MDIEENSNFKKVELYVPSMKISEIVNAAHTHHLNASRLERLDYALKINEDAPIHTSFLVDKGHWNGPEIHSITENAIIFIVNERTKMFITVLLARPNQVRRLYRACGLNVPEHITDMAKYFQQNDLNNF